VTTTLRPSGPEERGPGGSRERRFAVCVNGREVGAIRLGTDRQLGADVGRVVSLEIDAPDRRRGRGAVAALAAEEVLRGWGCRDARTTVPAESPYGLRLAASLGYAEANVGMVKRLSQAPPQPPGGVAVRPMDEADYRVWQQRTRAEYVGRWIAAGVPRQRAEDIADADYVLRLPDGVRTAGTALRVLSDTGTGADLGWLWVRVTAPDGPAARPWVYLVEVAEEHRGRGHGRTLMLAAERECLAAGVHDLGLNVFASNTRARRLYDSLGYRPMSYEMVKSLL
jgi:GNAT superfamily N-acetyltransferase